jgi:hypothetical protein
MRWLGIRTALCPPCPSEALVSKLIHAIKDHQRRESFSLATVAGLGGVSAYRVPPHVLYPALGFSQLKLWQVIIVAAAALLGDQIGYGVARWGGRRLVARISRRIGGEAKIRRAEALAKRCRTDHPGAKNSQPNPGAFLSTIVQYWTAIHPEPADHRGVQLTLKLILPQGCDHISEDVPS